MHETPPAMDRVILPQRLFHGGLPPALLADSKKPTFYREWMDAFDRAALDVFRGYYPKGRNFRVSPSGAPAFTKRFGAHEVRTSTPSELHMTKRH